MPDRIDLSVYEVQVSQVRVGDREKLQAIINAIPGCAVVASTVAELETALRQAVASHLNQNSPAD